MSSEETKLINSEENINKPASDEAEASAPQPPPASNNPAPSMAADSSADDEESRASGDVDFGQLLDQFEQEQASLQEGEVVR
jgi:hypothetical protein